MAIFSDALINSLKEKLEREGYEKLTPSELLIVVSAHFNHDLTSLKKAAWGSMYALWALVVGVVGSVIANLIIK